MAIKSMDHVSIVVDDLAAAKEFFAELGLELDGETSVEGDWVDRVVGLEDIRSDIAMMRTPDGHAPHGAELVGEVEEYRDIFRLCYVRGPEGVIIELAERLG